MKGPYINKLSSNDPRIIKGASTRKNLVHGLKVLESLWKRGILYKDLEANFYFTWLAYSNGNLLKTAKLARKHRNTIIRKFHDIFHTKNSLQLRKLWNGIREKKNPFPDKVKLLYDRTGLRPRFSRQENLGLVNLWLMGFPHQVIRSHYFIWSVRNGRGLKEMKENSGEGLRTIKRFREYALRPGSPAMRWLEPLKLKNKDWYFKRGKKTRAP